jgi:sigma-E factor negative regulatory protein RseC
MVTENGVVIDSGASFARILAKRSYSCKSCASKDNCGMSDKSDKEVIITVKNTLNVEKGDYVVVGMKTSPFLIISFLLYVFPVILMIIGALIGDHIALFVGLSPNFLSILTGALFLILSYVIIRRKSKSISDRESYKPFLVRKRMMSGSDSCAETGDQRLV